MDLPKRVSLWSVEDVLEWLQEHFPAQMSMLYEAIVKHAISGTTHALNSARFLDPNVKGDDRYIDTMNIQFVNE